MFEMYIKSVLIYMMIIFAMAQICRSAIINNGWVNRYSPEGSWLWALFCMAAVPVLRLFFIGVMLYMSVRTPEEFDEWRAEFDNKQNGSK